MVRLTALMPAATLLLALLSGCTLPDSDTSATSAAKAGATQDSYTVTLTNFNGGASPQLTQGEDFTLPSVHNNTDFTFTEKVEGSPVLASDHVGGHFGLNMSDEPSTTTYPIPCTHITGSLPNTADGFTITCRAPAAPGTYHLRGHARITQDGSNLNWWSSDFRFKVV